MSGKKVTVELTSEGSELTRYRGNSRHKVTEVGASKTHFNKWKEANIGARTVVGEHSMT